MHDMLGYGLALEGMGGQMQRRGEQKKGRLAQVI
jgi:hypothetical protein